jgi:pyroglutamyl-peptidase
MGRAGLTTPRPILVTGFEPFGGDAVNPSALVAQALDGQTLGGARVHGVVLPCVFGAAITAIKSALDLHRPQLVLALGLAASRAELTPERVAINLDDARIADNAGAQPIDTPVIAGAPAAYFATLPIKTMTAALRGAGVPASVSHSAGTFVCNHVFYGLQHAARRRRGLRSGFMHLPPLDVVPLDRMVGAVAASLEAALATRDDADVSEGRID